MLSLSFECEDASRDQKHWHALLLSQVWSIQMIGDTALAMGTELNKMPTFCIIE